MADIASIGLSHGRLRLSAPVLLGVLAYLASLAAGQRLLDDPDILWHIVTGRWIIAHGALPHADFLSHSVTGTKWVAHEWLAEIVMGWSYDRLGWHGLIAVAGSCAGVSMAVYARSLLRFYQPIHVLIIAFVTWLVLQPHLLARPHILALPCLVLWMTSLVEARRAQRAPPVALALLMIPWVNLHGSFLVGLGFAALFMGEAVIEAPDAAARRRVATAWGAFLAAGIAASLVTPNGIEAYLLPVRLLEMKFALSILVEWMSPNFQNFQPLEVWLLLALFAALTVGIRLPATRLLMVLLLLHMALKHARHSELLAFLTPLLVAAPVAAQLAGMAGRRPAAAEPSGLDRWMADLARPAAPVGIALAGALVLAASALAASSAVKPPAQFMPAAAVRAAAEHGITGPVFNEDLFGGYLISAGIPTFIDGRADMYGDAFIEREFKAARALSNDLPALLDEYKIEWTLMPPTSMAVVLLDLLPGWRRLYADDIAVVHVRRGTPGETTPK